jgi:hypothetical protein
LNVQFGVVLGQCELPIRFFADLDVGDWISIFFMYAISAAALSGVSKRTAVGITAGSPRVTPLVKNRTKPTWACLVEPRSDGSC